MQSASHSHRLVAVALSASLVVAAVIAGCGGSSSATKTQAPKTHASSTPAGSSTPVSSTQGGQLSGKWSGQYGGAYTGTFNLNWAQSGSKLSGKITLSSPPETTGITGSVSGGTIKFGTVSGAIYNGTVSGNAMSGNYTTPTGGGSWSASKS